MARPLYERLEGRSADEALIERIGEIFNLTRLARTPGERGSDADGDESQEASL